MTTTLRDWERVDGVLIQARTTARERHNMNPSNEQWQKARADLIAGRALLLAKPPQEPGARPFEVRMVNIGSVPLTVGWNPVEQIIVSVMAHNRLGRESFVPGRKKGKR